MATDKPRLPRPGEPSIPNPIASHLRDLLRVGLHPDIAKHFQATAQAAGCDLTTHINDVLRKVMHDGKI